MQLMNIGDAATAAAVTPKMIRHYESLGLIPEAERTESGYRLYGEREIAMLRFIRQSRVLGFSMQQIGELLALWRDPSRQSSQVKKVALSQLEELQERQRELDLMRGTLEHLLAQCRGDGTAHCAILDSLADGAALQARDHPQTSKKALKVVRGGERVTVRPSRKSTAQAPAPSPHAALMAWSRGITHAA